MEENPRKVTLVFVLFFFYYILFFSIPFVSLLCLFEISPESCRKARDTAQSIVC